MIITIRQCYYLFPLGLLSSSLRREDAWRRCFSAGIHITFHKHTGIAFGLIWLNLICNVSGSSAFSFVYYQGPFTLITRWSGLPRDFRLCANVLTFFILSFWFRIKLLWYKDMFYSTQICAWTERDIYETKRKDAQLNNVSPFNNYFKCFFDIRISEALEQRLWLFVQWDSKDGFGLCDVNMPMRQRID